jgi:endonuclease YncB( thermonuclease family)
MGIGNDQDTRPKRRLRWDDTRGALRDVDGKDDEARDATTAGPPWWVGFILAAILIGIGLVLHERRQEETLRPARHGPLPKDVIHLVESRQRGESVPMIVGRVIRVVDGDTISVKLDSGPIEVRLHGIDAPEFNQPGGHDATKALRARIKRRSEVSMSPVEQDSYERLVADVYQGDEFVNEWLLREGHAWAYRFYTNDPRFCEWEGEARSAQRGLWGLPKKRIAPWDWRKRERDPRFKPHDYSNESIDRCIAELGQKRNLAQSSATTSRVEPVDQRSSMLNPIPSADAETLGPDRQPSKCSIKGNIGSKGDRIYHTPEMPSYDQTRIDASKGERWFCTVEGAEKAGWRAPRH